MRWVLVALALAGCAEERPEVPDEVPSFSAICALDTGSSSNADWQTCMTILTGSRPCTAGGWCDE
jgi:hypothetical protein